MPPSRMTCKGQRTLRNSGVACPTMTFWLWIQPLIQDRPIGTVPMNLVSNFDCARTRQSGMSAPLTKAGDRVLPRCLCSSPLCPELSGASGRSIQDFNTRDHGSVSKWTPHRCVVGDAFLGFLLIRCKDGLRNFAARKQNRIFPCWKRCVKIGCGGWI